MSEARSHRAPWEENAHACERRSVTASAREAPRKWKRVFDEICRSGSDVVKRSFPQSYCAET
jgi:hypothetical protein